MRSTDREGLEGDDFDENLAKESIAGLKRTIAQIDELGLRVPKLNDMLQESVEAYEGLSNVNLKPSYFDSLKIANEATEMGKEVVASYQAAASSINKTEELIRQEFSSQGDIHGDVYQHLILSPSLDLIKESKHCLKSCEFGRVYELLEMVRTMPRKVKERCKENAEIYRYCETILEDLKKEGVKTEEVEDVLRISRTAFLNGRFERVKELSEVIEQKAIELRERHRRAIQALKRAKRVAVSLDKINATSEEASELLSDACLAMRDGGYDKCADLADKATVIAHDVCRRYRKLTRRIDALRKEMRRIDSSGTEVPDDIDEMIARAERELKRGNHQGTQAEVEIAALLLDRYESSP